MGVTASLALIGIGATLTAGGLGLAGTAIAEIGMELEAQTNELINECIIMANMLAGG